jgi:uncharacterized protein YdiU (UPF0061 family)
VLHACALDMTLTYRWLARLPSFAQGRPGAGEQADQSADALLKAASYEPCSDEDRVKLASWLQRYAAAAVGMGMDDQTRRVRMDAVNPKYVLRNYMAQLAIDAAAQGDSSVINELLQVLRAPYAEQPEAERWAVKRPDWARQRAGCSMLSCSS